MDKSITKDILKNELDTGQRPAVELLYTRYSGMLFSYILQFVDDRDEAGMLLGEVFVRLSPRLRQALASSLSLYCWLQVEARKIVLEYRRENPREKQAVYSKAYYFSLLEEASPEQQWVFRELFIYGRGKEELALQSGKDLGHIAGVLREAMQIIRNKLA